MCGQRFWHSIPLFDRCSREGGCTPSTTEAFFGRAGTPPSDGVAVSSLILSKSLKGKPPFDLPKIILRYPNPRMLSRPPLQRWREPYRLEYISKTSTSLCFANHPLGSNDDWLWQSIC